MEEHLLLFPESFTPLLLLGSTRKQGAFPTPLLHFTSFSRLPWESPSLTHSVASHPVTHHPHQPLLQIFMLYTVFSVFFFCRYLPSILLISATLQNLLSAAHPCVHQSLPGAQNPPVTPSKHVQDPLGAGQRHPTCPPATAPSFTTCTDKKIAPWAHRGHSDSEAR